MQEAGLQMNRERFQLRPTQEEGDLLGDDGSPLGVGEKLKGQAWEMGRTAGNPCTRGPISIMAQEGHPWDVLGHPCCCTCHFIHPAHCGKPTLNGSYVL